MRILLVHEVNYLSKTIYEFQILPEILSLLGHSVTVVDYNDSWKSETDGAGWVSQRQVYPAIHRAYDRARISLYRPAMIRVPLLSRISGAVNEGFEVARLLSQRSFDAVLLYGLPTIGIQTLLAARAYEVPVAFRAIDVTHELVPPALELPTRMLESIVFNNADLNIALTPLLRNYIQEYEVPDSRMRLLPSGVDTEMFSPGPKTKDDGPIVLFMGTIYRFSGLDRVIQDWKNLLAVHPRAKLVILGAGEDQARLEGMAGENVIFPGLQPYSRLPEWIRSSDVCINPFELNGITEKILPTKLFQYLACGKPVVATKLPGTMPFLSGEENGIVYADTADTVNVLTQLLSDPERCARLGKCGTAAARRYDWVEIAKQMAVWLAELAADRTD
ncbi:MAG TPA: glycosyltransferase family 4 protein [Terriglobia bacterium]|jgi:glycosyltransferase involved in cell wall biosynthesis